MAIYQAAILGVVQGASEFLPISSSAHLILFPWLLGWPEHSLAFDVALHMGTLLAILLYFAQDFKKLILESIQKNGRSARFLGLLLIGSVPGALAGIFGEKVIEHTLRGPITIAAAMIGIGLLLWLADRIGRKNRDMGTIGWTDAIAIGSAQALALWPGVSRSGITMTTGLLLGLTRPAAATFSFMLAAPIMLGAGLFEGRKLLHGLPPGETWSAWIVGLAVSAVVGLFAIRFLLNYLQKSSFKPFVIYRIALGILILLFALR